MIFNHSNNYYGCVWEYEDKNECKNKTVFNYSIIGNLSHIPLTTFLIDLLKQKTILF